MLKQEAILAIVEQKGPLLPIHIANEAKMSMLFAGAYLSELTSSKKILVSNLKVGSSPLYYAKGQEIKLENYIRYLEPKEQEAVLLLKKHHILNDKELEPSIRVALRQTKDFAIAVKVNLKNESELYWKWYMLPNEDAERMIRDELTKKLHPEIETKKEPEQPAESKQKETIETPKETVTEVIKEEKQKLEKPKKAIKKKVTEKKPTIQKELVAKPEPIKTETIETKVPEYKPETQDELLESAKQFFKEKGIKVLDCETVIQGKELDLHITISTVVGELPFFCKIKKKARSTEGDLFSTVLSAQKKGLPALYISTGSINQKAKEILNTKSHNIQFLSMKPSKK